MGLDQAQALPTWKDWQRLVAQAIICVANRVDIERPESSELSLPEHFKHLPSERWRHVAMPLMRISATLIRHRQATHQSLDGLVIPAVASYIDQHHLYRST
jgi:nicotinate-nucleotide adenylyltransferase